MDRTPLSVSQLSRRSLLGMAAGIPAVMALGACHGVSAPAAASGDVLKVGNQKGTIRSLMTSAGTLQGATYRTEWSEFPAAQHLLEALSAGAVDVGLVGDAPYLFDFINGSDLQVVSAVTYGDGSSVAIIVPPGSSIRSVADLKGKRVATGKISIGHYLLLRALESAGLTTRDITPVFMAPSDAKAAFASGQIDAWSTWSPFLATAVLRDKARVLVSGNGLLKSHAYQIATPKAIRDKQPQLRDFLTRLDRAYQWENNHASDFAAALSRDTGLPLDVALATVSAMHPVTAPIDDGVVADAQDIVHHLAEAGVAPTGPRPIEQAFAPAFRVKS